jgi:hypothetical protein
MDNELKLLLGEPYTCSNGDIVTLGKVPFGKLNIFSEMSVSLFQKVDDLQVQLVSVDAKKAIEILFTQAFEEMVSLMGLLLNKPREWFDTIDASDGIEIAMKLYEKNFDDKVKKNLKAILQKFISQLQTRFKLSSPPGIPGTTSEDTPSTRSTPSPEAS